MNRLKKGAAATALAVALVGGFEGLRLYSYQDVVSVWTACYGETKGMGPGNALAAVVDALEAGGVEFIPENGGGSGVRLKGVSQ